MLIYFIGLDYTNIIIEMIKHQKTDNVILEYIKNSYNQYIILNNNNLYYLSKLTDKIFKYTKEFTDKPKILDIGCGDAKRAKLINSLPGV